MKRSLAALAALVLVLPGCASSRNDMSGPVVGTPVNVPDHFMVARSGLGKSAEPKAGEGCRNPMVDPRDRTELLLKRSADGKGDYWIQSELVGSQKYGLTSQQFLRIDCATGKAIGIVAQ